jgi:hypothetical protein
MRLSGCLVDHSGVGSPLDIERNRVDRRTALPRRTAQRKDDQYRTKSSHHDSLQTDFNHDSLYPIAPRVNWLNLSGLETRRFGYVDGFRARSCMSP